MDLSIVINIEDHPPNVEEIVASIAAQTLDAGRFEVIIVDACRQHELRDRCDKAVASHGLSNIRFVELPKSGRASGSNYAIRNTTAPIILFLADDYVPDPDCARVHLEFHQHHADEAFIGIGSGYIPDHLHTEFSRWLESTGRLAGTSVMPTAKSVPEEFFYMGNSSVKRSLLERVGLFDEDYPFDGWDDYDLSARLRPLKPKAVFLPAAVAAHMHRITLEDYRFTQTRAGAAACIFELRHAPPYPWNKWKARSCLQQELLSKAAWLMYKITRDQRYLHGFYKWTLASHFLKGYLARKGQHAAQPPRTTATHSDNLPAEIV